MLLSEIDGAMTWWLEHVMFTVPIKEGNVARYVHCACCNKIRSPNP